MRDVVISLAVALGFVFLGVVITMDANESALKLEDKIEAMIEECQQELPRNQYCDYEIIVKPGETDNGENRK